MITFRYEATIRQKSIGCFCSRHYFCINEISRYKLTNITTTFKRFIAYILR